MNPLTLVKRIQKINSKEAELGISEAASWHAKYKDSAYVYVGGIPFDLTEGDLLAVFAQYGEIVDCNLVRDKGTGKSKGFAFVAYEDQRSTNLAVDNLNGAQVLGRIIRVDHVTKYKKKEEEDEETEQLKREARGVCRAFQRGDCNRGAGCKFSHDEKRAADTGWGAAEDRGARWGHDGFDGPAKSGRRLDTLPNISETLPQERKSRDRYGASLRTKSSGGGKESRNNKPRESNSRDQGYREREKPTEWKEKEISELEASDKRAAEKLSRRVDADPNSREKRTRRHHDHEIESYCYEERGKRGRDTRYENENRTEWKEKETNDDREDSDKRGAEKSSRKDVPEPNSRENHDRDEKRSRRHHEMEYFRDKEKDKRGGDTRYETEYKRSLGRDHRGKDTRYESGSYLGEEREN